VTPAESLRLAADLRKQGRPLEALRALQSMLRSAGPTAEQVESAGRALRRDLVKPGVDVPLTDVLMLGQCTISWVVSSLVAVGWGQDLGLRVVEGAYDSLLQDLSRINTGEWTPRVVVLVPWNQRLAGVETPAEASHRIEAEIEFWKSAWQLVHERFRARILQVSYDWMFAGPAGHHSAQGHEPIAMVRRMNEALRRELPEGAFLLDLEQLSGLLGREQFYDPRRYYWTKQPFSEEGACRLARDLCAGLRALLTGPKKVLVLDLDNTLWGGIVGEVGAQGIALGDDVEGESYRAFQRYLKGLAARGVLLAVATKNNPDDAREPFVENPDMILRLEHLAAFEASWGPKAEALTRIAQTLNLGLDSFVFFDDNPAEREQVRQALPMVAVVETPPDPADYIRALERERWFEATAITHEDRARTEQYVVERQRRELQLASSSLDDYLTSLEMIADVQPIDESVLPRVVQLLSKTNQFNLTTRRHSIEEVRSLLVRPGTFSLCLKLHDRFGDHGLTAVLIAVEDSEQGERALRIETWLMSCRIIARTVENLVFNMVLDHCRRQQIPRIIGEYIPTKKNGLVARLYADLGLEQVPESTPGTIRFSGDVQAVAETTTFVRLNTATATP